MVIALSSGQQKRIWRIFQVLFVLHFHYSIRCEEGCLGKRSARERIGAYSLHVTIRNRCGKPHKRPYTPSLKQKSTGAVQNSHNLHFLSRERIHVNEILVLPFCAEEFVGERLAVSFGWDES